MATTNLYAVALTEGANNEKSKKILSHAFFISLILGIILNIIQYAFAPPMINILSGSAKECIQYALSYARIRSFAGIIIIIIIIIIMKYIINLTYHNYFYSNIRYTNNCCSVCIFSNKRCSNSIESCFSGSYSQFSWRFILC